MQRRLYQMQVRAMFSEKQPNYRYMPINDNMADVFIYKFIEEVKNEEDNTTQFVHDMNEFRVNISEITEDMIKENPMKYLTYNPDKSNILLEERISALEDAVLEMAGVIYNG